MRKKIHIVPMLVTQPKVLFLDAATFPLVAIHFGVVAAASSHPALFHRKNDVPLAESLATIGPVIVVMATMIGVLLGIGKVESMVTAAYWPQGGGSHGDRTTMWWGLCCGLVGIAILFAWIGVRVAERNLRVVLGPRAN